MRRLVFVLWVVGFYLAMRMGDYIDFKSGVVDRTPPDAQGFYYLIIWGIWIGIAVLLWRDGSGKTSAQGKDRADNL